MGRDEEILCMLEQIFLKNGENENTKSDENTIQQLNDLVDTWTHRSVGFFFTL